MSKTQQELIEVGQITYSVDQHIKLRNVIDKLNKDLTSIILKYRDEIDKLNEDKATLLEQIVDLCKDK